MNGRRRFVGKWITDGEFKETAPLNVFHRQTETADRPADLPGDCHILFRRKFTLPKSDRVTVYITADDYYKLYVNGVLALQGPAAGYPWHYYYNVADITGLCRVGENTIAVHTYYQGLVNRVWVSGDLRHGLLLDVEADGETVLCSDESFLTRRHGGYKERSRYGYDTQFSHVFDFNAAENGFFIENFDDSAWSDASLRKFVDYELFEQPVRPLQVYCIFPAIVRREKNIIFADVGQEIVGYVRATFKGRRGDRVSVDCAEETDGERPLYMLRCGCDYRDEFILSGGEDTTDLFDYKAFRYIGITLPGDCELVDLKVVVRHYPFEQRAGCGYGGNLEKVFRLCADTLHYGVQEGYLDCPTREKGQYFGDACYASAAHLVLTGDTAMMKKVIENAFESAPIDEGLLAGGPNSFMQEIAEFPLMICMLCLVYFEASGDAAFLGFAIPRIERLLDCYEKRYRRDALLYDVDKWCVVDWPPSARDGYDFELKDAGVSPGTHNVVNAYYIGALKSLRALCGAGSLPFTRAAQLAETEKIYTKTFYSEEEKLFCDAPGSNHCAVVSNVLPYIFGINDSPEFSDALLRLLKKKRLDYSNLFISPLIITALFRMGEESFALDLLADENYWLNMIEEGATTTFEAFSKNKKWNTSLFHTAFAFPVIFLADETSLGEGARRAVNLLKGRRTCTESRL